MSYKMFSLVQFCVVLFNYVVVKLMHKTNKLNLNIFFHILENIEWDKQ